ncbi:MAG: NACHT domain-containing protein, partial [Myxococcota bacterium]
MVTRKSGKLAWGFVLLLPWAAVSGYAAQPSANNQQGKPPASNQELTQEMTTAQSGAAKWAKRIEENMGTNPQKVLEALQQLQRIDASLAYNPQPLLERFVSALAKHEHLAIRLLVAQIARPFVDAAYLLNKYGDFAKKSDKKELVSTTDNISKHVQRRQEQDPLAHRLDYEVQRMRAAIDALRSGKKFKKEALSGGKETVKTLVAAVANPKKAVSKVADLAKQGGKQTYYKLLREYRQEWYEEGLHVIALRAEALQSQKALWYALEKMHQYRQRGDDWQKFYAAIEVLAYVAWYSNNEQLVAAVFDGMQRPSEVESEKEEPTELPGLLDLTTYTFSLRNKWRVQAKIAEEAALLLQHSDSDVRGKANQLLTELKKSEHKEVQVIVQNADSVAQAEKLLRQDWSQESDFNAFHKKLTQDFDSQFKQLRHYMDEQFDQVHARLRRALTRRTFQHHTQDLADHMEDLKEQVNELREPWMDKIRGVSDAQWEKVQRNGFMQGIEHLYVPPKAKLSPLSPADFDLREETDKFLDSDDKVFLVLSDQGGSGKSVFVQLLERLLWTDLEDGESEWVPVYIPLNTLKDPANLVEEVLKDERRIGLNKLDTLRKAKVLFILDGFDEIAKDKWVNVIAKNGLQNWRESKVIITSRDEELTFSDHAEYFSP